MSGYNDVFDIYAEKTVTKTDKSKAAYVPTAEQRHVLAVAGVPAQHNRVFDLKVLDADQRSVSVSYYNAERLTAPGRPPEARMGREFISSWLQEGETVILGLVEGELFAAKKAAAPELEKLIQRVARRADPRTILARAKAATGKPERVTITRSDFKRNPFVVQAAVLRARGKCEMPGCAAPLFARADGEVYLEVHHVVPLGEGGDDTLANVAALCPHCHRELHFGELAKTKRARLKPYIASL